MEASRFSLATGGEEGGVECPMLQTGRIRSQLTWILDSSRHQISVDPRSRGGIPHHRPQVQDLVSFLMPRRRRLSSIGIGLKNRLTLLASHRHVEGATVVLRLREIMAHTVTRGNTVTTMHHNPVITAAAVVAGMAATIEAIADAAVTMEEAVAVMGGIDSVFGTRSLYSR